MTSFKEESDKTPKISCELFSHDLLHGQNKIHLHALKGRMEPSSDPTVDKRAWSNNRLWSVQRTRCICFR